jgi:hypothetical protein
LWSKRTPKSGAGGKNNMVPLGVLERLYSFLYLATMPSSDPSAMHKRNVLHIQSLENLTDSTATAGGKAKASEDGGGAVQLPAPLSVEDRTVAVQVLVALACSRGCVRGLLLSIAVLLGVGLSPPPSKPNLEDAAAPVQLRKPAEKPRRRPSGGAVREGGGGKITDVAKKSNGGDLKIPGIVAPQRKKQIKKPRKASRGGATKPAPATEKMNVMNAPERTPERNEDWDTRNRHDPLSDVERDESGSPVPANALLVLAYPY